MALLLLDEMGRRWLAGAPADDPVRVAESAARAVRRRAPTELVLPPPSSWATGSCLAGFVEALTAAVACRVPVIRVGRVVLRPEDPVDAGIIALVVARSMPQRDTKTTRRAPAAAGSARTVSMSTSRPVSERSVTRAGH